MTSLLKNELNNAQQRYLNLLKTNRNDQIAKIVLNRMIIEIQTLERKVKHEEEPRQEINTCTSPRGFTRRIREAMHRFWVKCYGNNHAIPGIPAIETLQEARATT